jgi:ATP-dependent exoDNAse (exonuclease V) beta subunit
LFDEIHAAYSDPGYHPSREVLDVSRRSHRAIVEFNNEVFSLENLSAFMRTRDGKEGLLVPARPSDFDELERVYKTAEQKVLDLEPEGCVRVEMLEGARKEASREDARPRVMARLKELVSRFRLREIAVLVRKNDDVEAVTRWLIEEGIPSSSERTLNIKEDPLVAEVVAFLKFLVSPVDDAAFGAFLQGDIMAFASGIPSGTWRDLIVAWRQDKKDRLYKFFSAAYPKVWENLVEEFFRNAGLYPAYETLASFYRRTGVLEHFTDERGFLVHFLGLVKANEEEFPDLADFLEYYEELEGEDLYVDVAGGDAVQVMTVHKAKGLEFRAVILPFLTVTAAPGRPAQKRALEYVLKPEEDGLKLYHINKTLAQYSDKAEELDVDRRMQAFFAELNSAYVALTRAACEMYIYIPPRAGNSRNLACYLIPERLYARGTPAAAYPSKKNDDAGTPVELAPPACRDWIAFLQDEFKEDPLALMKERREGVMAHALLERIVPSYAPTAAQGLELAVASLFPGGEAVDVAIRLSAFLEAPVVKPFFEGISGKVLTEVELANRFGDVRRIDRLIVEPGRVTVIDFKMGRASSENGEAQVREYMELVQDIYPGRKVRGVLLFIREKEAQELS